MKNNWHKFKISKNGFTLAEVLITLVIIGVVAALTIPTAINNTKDQELKSGFSKAYSTLSQALYKTEMNDFYGYAKCFYGDSGLSSEVSECYTFFNSLKNHLSTQKICNNHSLSEGCVPVYQSYNKSDGCLGFSENYINNIDKSYVLSNGQIIIFYPGMPIFLIDINGHKGPNAYGKDLFSITLHRNYDTGIYIYTKNDGSGCPFPVSGGRTTPQMIQYSLTGKK